ncbi:MAG: hypothetical protein QOE05_570, partial [Actinomycetota bacterium]|nr:hypothetical protein [Actinomycetota bacterium]
PTDAERRFPRRDRRVGGTQEPDADV